VSEAGGITLEHRRLLAAALDRILPAGDRPSACELGALEGADWLMGQPELRSSLPLLRSGLTLLDTSSMGTAGCSFVAADAAQQDAVLRALHDAPHPTMQRFVALLVRLALTGAFGPPALGGNRNGAGWRYIGYESRQRVADRVASPDTLP
jgi:hypothetical protein